MDEVKCNKNRSAKSLLPIIQENVKEGSIVFTDFWAAYNNIKLLDNNIKL